MSIISQRCSGDPSKLARVATQCAESGQAPGCVPSARTMLPAQPWRMVWMVPQQAQSLVPEALEAQGHQLSTPSRTLQFSRIAPAQEAAPCPTKFGNAKLQLSIIQLFSNSLRSVMKHRATSSQLLHEFSNFRKKHLHQEHTASHQAVSNPIVRRGAAAVDHFRFSATFPERT